MTQRYKMLFINQLENTCFLSDEVRGVKYTPGFVAPVMGDTYLKQHEDPEDCEYYLCGPPMMAKTVLDLLHSLGVGDDMIRFDNFGG